MMILRLLSCSLALLFSCSVVPAQTLRGQWVAETEQKIARVRQTDVRVIVQDARGDNAAGVTVRIEQLRHAFPLGFSVGKDGLADFDDARPVYRCFNAISLDRLSTWSQIQPIPAERDIKPLRPIVAEAQQRGMTVRWGGLISADLGRNPNWVAGLRGRALEGVLEAHVNSVLDDYGTSVGQFDLYTHCLDHRFVESRLGEPMVRRLFEQAKADAPRAMICARFEDCLTGRRLQQMVTRVTEMRQRFIPIDRIAIEQRIGGSLIHSPLSRALAWLGKLEMGVVVVGLEVGGESDAAAALNIETLLRTLFADPHIEGIWFAGLRGEGLSDPNAALVDAEGKPTAPGSILDGMFHEVWRTDFEGETDELGNVTARVFAGAHRVSATLADGTTIKTRVWIDLSPEQRVILLQPLRPKANR